LKELVEEYLAQHDAEPETIDKRTDRRLFSHVPDLADDRLPAQC
jgi:hypothetical protein